jgi:hypothetical protein
MRIDQLIVSAAISTVVAGVVSAALFELKAWLPWFTKWFFRRAIARLSADQRERYREEWQSHIDEVPGNIGKIIAAVGFVLAAKKMPAETAKPRTLIDPGVPQGVQIVVNATCRIQASGVLTVGPPREQKPPSTQG